VSKRHDSTTRRTPENGGSTSGGIAALRRLALSSAVFAASAAVRGASRFLLIPLLVRYLSQAQYGLLGTLNSVAGLLTMCLTLGLDEAVAREFFDYRDRSGALRSYLTTILLYLGGSSSLVLLLAVAGVPLIARWLLPGSAATIVQFFAVVLGMAALSSFLSVLGVLLRVRRRAVAFGLSQIALAGLLVGLTAVALMGFRWQVAGVMLAQVTSIGLVVAVLVGLFIYEDTPLGDRLRRLSALPMRTCDSRQEAVAPDGERRSPLFDRAKLRKALSYGLPLLPYAAANWCTSASDRLILTGLRTMEEVGVYNLGYSLAMVMNVIVVTPINFAYAPHFYEAASRDPLARKQFAFNAELYVAVVGSICLIGMLFSGEFVSIIAPASYSGAQPVIAICVLAFYFLGIYLVVSLPLFFMKRTKPIACISIAGAVLNILANLLFVPIIGIVGAALTTLLAYVLMAVLAGVLARRVYPIPYRWSHLWGIPAAVAGFGFAFQAGALVSKVLLVLGFVAAAGVLTLRLKHKLPPGTTVSP